MAKDKPEISVILATYNEAENISDLIFELDYYISSQHNSGLEFIVVDDDSLDRTWEIVEKKFANEPKVKLIHRTQERSLASAIQRGIQESRGEIVCWMDCDFSMPPYKIVELLQKIDVGYDIAVGSRFVKGGKDIRGETDSFLAVILSRLMNLFIALLLDYSFRDYTSGFVAMKKVVLEKVKIRGNYGEYFIDLIYQAKRFGYKIIEVPYYCLPRRRGFSKTGANLFDYLKKGWVYILVTCKLKLTSLRQKNNL